MLETRGVKHVGGVELRREASRIWYCTVSCHVRPIARWTMGSQLAGTRVYAATQSLKYRQEGAETALMHCYQVPDWLYLCFRCGFAERQGVIALSVGCAVPSTGSYLLWLPQCRRSCIRHYTILSYPITCLVAHLLIVKAKLDVSPEAFCSCLATLEHLASALLCRFQTREESTYARVFSCYGINSILRGRREVRGMGHGCAERVDDRILDAR